MITTNIIHISDAINSRLDPHQFNQERMIMLKRIYSSRQWCKLKDVVTNVKTTTQTLTDNDIYIGLENITSNTGEYIPTIEKQSISSAAVFKQGNILFSKLRPYLNKVYHAEFSGKCSTEFHVFEAKNINPKFLTILLRSNIVLVQTKHLMTGNTLPRLQTTDVENLILPVLSNEEQERIVNIYQKALNDRFKKNEEAKSLLGSIDPLILKNMGVVLPSKDTYTKENIATLSQLVSNRYDPYYHNKYFEEAFKHLKETSNYKLVRLSDISVLITSGITPKSGGDDYTDSEHGVAFIRSGNIDIMGEVDFDNLLYIKREVHDTRMKSSKVQNGDIMIAIVGATIGQVGIYHSSREANINQAIALVRLKDGYNPEYIKEVIKSSIGQLNLDRLKRPVARANINLEEISSMLIPVPEIEIQNEMVKSVVSIRQQAKRLQKEGVELLEIAKQEIEKIILG